MNIIIASSFNPAYLFLPFLIVLLLGFEVAMFIDAWTNNGISRTRRNWWLIGMVLIHPFVALIYCVTDRNKRISRS